jgi:ferredoxin-like protein FixX
MTEWKIGDIVQINPEIEHRWGGCLVIVTEPKQFGCQGILLCPKEFEAFKFDGIAYVRVTYEECVYCGRCEWILTQEDET